MEREIGTRTAINSTGKRITLRLYEILIFDRTASPRGDAVGWIHGGQFSLKMQDRTPVHWIEGETFEVFGTGERLTLI